MKFSLCGTLVELSGQSISGQYDIEMFFRFSCMVFRVLFYYFPIPPFVVFNCPK